MSSFFFLPQSMKALHRRCAQTGEVLWVTLPLLLLVAWATCCCVAVTAQGTSPPSPFCPIGWALWPMEFKARDGVSSDDATVWCVQPQKVRVAPAETVEACAHIFDLRPPRGWSEANRELIPQPFSVHSHEQNLWLQELLSPFFGDLGELVALGGAAGFGDIFWWDGMNNVNGVPSYTNFAPSTDWQTHSGCIAMQRDGVWRLVDCKTPQMPFVCAFQWNALNETNTSSNDGDNSSDGGADATTTNSSTGDNPVDVPQPTRPPVPQPPPECLDGWSSYKDKCYRLYAELIDGGERGMNQQAAQRFCQSIHPHVTLTAVLNAEENAFLGRLVQDSARDHNYDLAQMEVFIGGIFTARGSVGVWYEDALWYGERDYMLSFPSSPTWPTAKNNLYFNWGVGEPSMSFGCVAVDNNGTWRAVDSRLSLPFVCAYLNDGSVKPEVPTTAPESDSASSSVDTGSNTTAPTPTPHQSDLCSDDWVYFAPTNRCFRVLTDRAVSAADLEQSCGRLLEFASDDTIHAATIKSVEESAFVGRLVAEAGLQRVLVGVSYIERGMHGLYLDGTSAWESTLAESLWAVGQPSRDSGCVVLDHTGAWYYFPCGTPANAYACAYSAGAVIAPTSTPAPTDVPTTTTTTSTSAPEREKWPLETRIASLSGAVHLVVAAGTVGTYTVAGSGGRTDGLLLMFAPDLSEIVAKVGWDEHVKVSPCLWGYKKQEYIFAVMQGVVTVFHPNETMRGRVCVSDDGVHYVPAGNITFEVLDVALRGFIPFSSSQKEAEEAQGGGSNESSVIGGGNDSIFVTRAVGIRLWSSEALQFLFHRRLPGTRAAICRLRFSSSPDCTSGRYVLFGESLAVVERERGRGLITYQLANVVPSNGSGLDRLHDPAEDEEQPATEFFVCAAASINALPPQSPNSSASVWSEGNSYDRSYSSISDTDVLYENEMERNTSFSFSVDGQPMWLYTLIPHLRVHVTPPHVAVRGMWALPPSGFDTSGVFKPSSFGPSVKTLFLTQFSSPVIVFDGEGLREGMALLLSQKPGNCQRHQPTSARSSADSSLPPALDTMVAVSTVFFSSRALNGSSVAEQSRVAFMQLNLNHTGMWGTNFTEKRQTWHLCFAYTPLSRFVPLTGFKIIVSRARISLTATHEGYGGDVSSGSDNSSQLNLGVGFSGLLILWGLDVHMWSPSTISMAEIAFAHSPPGNARFADPTLQCTNTSLFYRQRSFGIFNPQSATNNDLRSSRNFSGVTLTEQQQQRAAVVVIPPGFLNEETTRRMRLCLSVPLPFQNNRRVFIPTSATVDVYPIEVHFIGPYAVRFPIATTDTPLTVVEVSENVNELVLPLFGYGLSDYMMLFLSEKPCLSLFDAGETHEEASEACVDCISRMNFTIMRPYDVPPNYRQSNSSRSAASVGDFFITLNETHTASEVADRVFGRAREPLFLCLYAPGTRRAVYPLRFKFVVRRPYIKSIRSIGAAPLQQEGEATVVLYASFVDLVVEGFGLHEGEAAFVPAVDCSNGTSFLWRSPVRTSAVPSMVIKGDSMGYSVSSSKSSFSSRYVSPLTSTSSWFLSLTQAHTARIGAVEPTDDVIDRFQWCVRYRDADADVDGSASDATAPAAAAAEDANSWRRGFVPTGIPYRLVIPRVDGFLFGNSTEKHIKRRTRHPTLGPWERLQIVGPLIDHTFALGNPLFMFLAEDVVPCKKLKKYFINTNSFDRFITAVNGYAIILPKLLNNTGLFKLCASAIHPERQSSEEGTEAALQFFELKGLRIELVGPVYSVFSLNRTDYVTVEQGQKWTLPIGGSGLSNMSLVRFRPIGANCSTPMPDFLDDVIVRNLFEELKLFGALATLFRPDGGDVDKRTDSHYIVLERDLIRGLSVQEYMLCFKPDRSTPWMSSDILLNVREHVRRPSRYSYFNADGSEDVVAATALPPTKIALEWLTNERDTTNIVGAAGREVAVALWCRGGEKANTSAVVPCGNWRRVMFVRPIDDGSDPCFTDFEAIQLDVVRGPYVLDDGILTIPRAVSRNVSFYPNATQPWILCLETAPERWRKSIHPLLQLQFTTVVPVGFRHFPDDASNTTATFFGRMGDADISDDRTDLEGNRTLILYVEDTSRIFYLNGYGIQRGFLMRFGSHCEEDVLAVDSEGNRSRAELVAAVQELNNTLLYEEPLILEDDHGVFLFPSTHFANLEARTPMCLSTNGGTSYVKTNLSLAILPSRLRRDLPADESHISELAFRRTLVVPRMSKGTVSIAELNAHDDNEPNSTNYRTDSGGAFAVGTRVLFSSACHNSREGLPIIVVIVPNILTLTEAHTRVATKGRLHICVQMPRDESSGGSDGGNVSDEDGRTHALAFLPTGFFFQVLDVTVTSVSLHRAIPSDVAEQNGIRHLVFCRGNESMTLLVTIESGMEGKETNDNFDSVDAYSVEEQYINMLNVPGALSFFRLAKFRLGRPCNVLDPQEPAATVTSLSNLTATFANNKVRIWTEDGSDAVIFVVPLHTERNETVEPWSPSSLCFSVDGGRHYMSVGISYISVSWAPTLRVRLSMGEEEAEKGMRNQSGFSSSMYVFEQTNHFGRLVDARYSTDSSSFRDTPLIRYLNGFTTDALWSGFLQGVGFVSSGELYLPALTIGDAPNESELLFFINYRQRDVPTGLKMHLEPMSLQCIGETPTTLQQVHSQSTGWLLPIASPCGRSIQAGVIVRFVDGNVRSCDTPEVDHAYVMDAFIMKPREWMGKGVTPTLTTLQLPTSIRYVPNGRYKLCVKKFLPYQFGRASVFVDTPVGIEVISSLSVKELSGLGQGVLAVFQGGDVDLTVRGSVVPFADDVRISFVPVDMDVQGPVAVCGTLWRNSGDRGVNGTIPTLWKRVTGGFTIRLQSMELFPVTPRTLYHVCYSVDGGISFHPAGDAPPFLQLTILPPTILGLGTENEQRLYNRGGLTTTALRLERLLELDSSTPSDSDPSSMRVTFFAERPPSYYHHPSLCFIGNGIGTGNGREATGALGALAVAVLRTDLFGEVCNGANLTSVIRAGDSESSNPLALPVFLVDTVTGCLWDPAATTGGTVGADGSRNLTGGGCDGAVLRDDWLNNTATLRRAGGLGATSLLKGSSSTEEYLRRLSTSYLLCTSVDGVLFYSANFLLRNESQGDVRESTFSSSLATAVPRESAVPLKNVSRLPLVLRVDPNINGSYYTRDLAVILQLVVRPRLATVPTTLELETSTESLVRFQRAVAELLHIDPAIVVVRLSNRRMVLPPRAENATVSIKYVTYTLSLSLLTDARVLDGSVEEMGTLTPSPELLLRYANLLRNNDTQTSLLSTLLPPAVSVAGLVTVRAPYVNFTFGTGVDLHAALLQHSHELPKGPFEEKMWRARFAAVPHATLVAEEIPDDVTKRSKGKLKWWLVSLLILLSIVFVIGSIFFYRRYLRLRSTKAQQQEERRRRMGVEA
ncbi:hypothetical protein MOQ_005871 [Trypanosoma cruzi marinkellei]|uniref:C-type lectin domain-containing protein n=1 Tax=Trypanosoma cruzi marinkellei TaxID=85056 RepID=K2N6M0_TRYCR|nr:hypothetical protein MOQ_005871 [Trypanosoma cruzi marinkellei]